MSTATLPAQAFPAEFASAAHIIGDDDVVELAAEVPPGKVISFDHAALCSALGIDDPTRVIVETDGLRRALITIYRSNPLALVRKVTLADLLMDRRGWINVGQYHNGRLARVRLFDPATGNAQRFILFGTTGAGKSRVAQLHLVAEKLNGIISWFADLKFGQSAPEARDQVDWFLDTLEGGILMLRSGGAVAHDRMARYSAMGRNAFFLGNPDRLLHVTIAEANRLLEPASPYREEATYWIKELGRTGRSVGVGLRLEAQASHLEELGGSDTLRAMLKEGEVTLLRWSSSMMRQLVADGLLPAGTTLTPIPKTLAVPKLVSQFAAADEDDDAPGTHGTAYLLAGPHPTSMMRHFQIGSVAPLPGLDPEILALYGPEEPARLEEASWQAAGDAYRWRDDPTVMAALCQAVATGQDPAELTGDLGDDFAPAPAAPAAATPGKRAKSLTADDRVLAVLEEAEEPMTVDQILAAVNADGGRQLKPGTINNTLTGLAGTEQIYRPDVGLYELAR